MRSSKQEVQAIRDGDDAHFFLIADGDSQASNPVDFGPFVTGLLSIPAGFNGYILFKHSLSNGPIGVFDPIHAKDDTAIVIDCSGNSNKRWVAVNPELMGARWLTIERYTDAALTTADVSGDAEFALSMVS